MTREDVMGILPEATESQVTGILNALHSELQTEKKAAEEWKAKAGQAQTLEEQLAEAERLKAEAEKQKEEAENKNLSEVDLLKKELEKRQTASDRQIAELKAQLAVSEINAYSASKNLTGEHMDVVLKAFGSDIDLAKKAIDKISVLKSEWESAAALAKEQEIAAASANPGGNSAGSSVGDSEDTAMQLARKLTPQSNGVNVDLLSDLRR